MSPIHFTFCLSVDFKIYKASVYFIVFICLSNAFPRVEYANLACSVI